MGVLLSSLATAGGVGLGCGTCCGTGISAFLSGYIMTNAKSFKESFSGFWRFYLGKITAVVLLCMSTSVLGSALMDENGYIGPVPVVKVVDLCMVGMALYLLLDLWRDRRGKKSCSDCRSKNSGSLGSYKPATAFLLGVGYGISPCAPLILIAGYCAALPFHYAAAVGVVFAAASAISPMLLLLLLSGALSGRIYKEIPKYMDLFRGGCYIAVAVFFIYSFFTGGTVIL